MRRDGRAETAEEAASQAAWWAATRSGVGDLDEQGGQTRQTTIGHWLLAIVLGGGIGQGGYSTPADEQT